MSQLDRRRLVAHAGASSVALACLLTFWTASVVAELSLGPDAIRTVKTGILIGLGVLIPALGVARATGLRLTPSGRPSRKAARMKTVAVLGALVLVPCAVALFLWARAGDFGPAFVMVQLVELAVGAVNVTLLGRNAALGARVTRAWLRSQAERRSVSGSDAAA